MNKHLSMNFFSCIVFIIAILIICCGYEKKQFFMDWYERN